MHPIELQISSYIEAVAKGEAVLDESAIEEFGERCKAAVRDRLKEAREKKFTLRMSNIGRPLRQLMLDKEYGYADPSPDFVLKMLYGSFYEAMTLLLLKASGTNVTDHDKQVSLDIGRTTIQGTLDVIIDGKVYDVKSASPYAYEHKFTSWESLAADDAFGYLTQGFLYAESVSKTFGGWIVINKATGEFKVIDIPEDIHDELKVKYLTEADSKIKHILSDGEIPPCDGVVEETYYKKASGNKILSNKCTWCVHKNKCHANLKYMPSKVSKSDTPKYVYYVELKEGE